MANFRVKDGQILTPGGQLWLAGGINVNDYQIGAAVSSSALTPLLSFFPGLGVLRVNCRSYSNGPAFFANVVAWCSAKSILMIFEDHNGISAPPLTGTALQTELAFYAALAGGFKDNPYVAFGTFNEPGNGTNLAAIAAQEVAIYNAIRGANSDALVFMELPSGGNPGLVGATAKGYDQAGSLPPSAYAKMTNIVWDLHYYGWVSGFSTNQAVVNQGLLGSVAGASGILGAQTITSADGVVPVFIGETGNSTTGGAIDANASEVLLAVAQSGLSYAVWGWDPDEQGDQLVTDQGQLTSFGSQVAAMIAITAKQGSASAPPTPTPTPALTLSAGTLTPTSGGSVKDAAGNTWTLSAAGAVMMNNAAVAGGGGTAALTAIGGMIYGQDAAKGLWYAWQGGQWVQTALPGTPPPTPPSAPTPMAIAAAQATLAQVTTALAGVAPSLAKIHADIGAL